MDTVSDKDFLAVTVRLVMEAVAIRLHSILGDYLCSWSVDGDGREIKL